MTRKVDNCVIKGEGEILLSPSDNVNFEQLIKSIKSDETLKHLMDVGIKVYFEWVSYIFCINGKSYEQLSSELEAAIFDKRWPF